MASYQQSKKLDLDDLDTLCDELHSVRRRWYNIGLQLGVPVTDLQQIESKHKHRSSCLRQMLKKWVELGSASWETLCDVLRLVGDDRKLATDLVEKYCSGKESGDPEAKRRRTEKSGHTLLVKGIHEKERRKHQSTQDIGSSSGTHTLVHALASKSIRPHPGRIEAQPIKTTSPQPGDLNPPPEIKDRPQHIQHYSSYRHSPEGKSRKFSPAEVSSLPSLPKLTSYSTPSRYLAASLAKPIGTTIPVGAPARYNPFFATSQTNEIRGAEMSASTTVVITAKKQPFTWKEYGLKLHIPDECLPANVNQCQITITVSIAGQYNFPENCHPVSAIYWLRCEPMCKFVKPVTLEMDHCAKRENTSKLHFVRAVCSQEHLPYTFRILKDGFFNQHTSYGIVELHGFSGIGVVQEDSTEIEREYCAMLFYLGKTILSYEIHFVVTWDTKAHLSIVKEDYREKQALSGHMQPIDFESDQIKLDIPMTGVTSEGWAINPLFPPVIIKKKVDNFEPGKMIPCCQLNATFASSKEGKVPSLKYCVKLLGAKKPFDMFNIIPSTTATTITKLKEALHDTKPKLKDLMTELLTKVASKWENIGIMLDLEWGQLNTIKADHGSDSENCLREMLLIWLSQVEPSPTWSAMAKAIESIGNADLARDLRSKYCKSS